MPQVVAGLDRVRAGPQPLVGGDDLGGLGRSAGRPCAGWPLATARASGSTAAAADTAVRSIVMGAVRSAREPTSSTSRGSRTLSARRVGDRLGQLGRGGQLQVVQEVDGLLEGGVLGQVVDVVTGVEEPALPAVDVRDPGLGGDHVLESLARSCQPSWACLRRLHGTGSASIAGGQSMTPATPHSEGASHDGPSRDVDPRRRRRTGAGRGHPPGARGHRRPVRLGRPGGRASTSWTSTAPPCPTTCSSPSAATGWPSRARSPPRSAPGSAA